MLCVCFQRIIKMNKILGYLDVMRIIVMCCVFSAYHKDEQDSGIFGCDEDYRNVLCVFSVYHKDEQDCRIFDVTRIIVMCCVCVFSVS